MKKQLPLSRTVVSVALGLVVVSSLSAYALSRCKDSPDDFFDDGKIQRIDIKIDSLDWHKTETALTEKFGEPGKFAMGGGPRPMHGPPPFMAPDGAPMEIHDSLHRRPGPGSPPGGPNDGNPQHMPPPGMPQMIPNSDSFDYIPCQITYNGKSWNNVGYRVKGNSSLMHTWMSKENNLPFRLKFNQFATSNDAPLFMGINKLSFSNGLKDDTYVREKLAYDLFAKAGMPCPRTVTCCVYIDKGKGPEFAGLYTAVEIVEDTMLKRVFGSNNGNCYKPEGTGAAFAGGTFDTTAFVKKNNKKSTFNDVAALYNTLNDSVRVTNAAAWETQLEAIFDVPLFLKWLAVNTVIQNWDAYGTMAHNYYLYNNPKTGKLTWIPWDLNESLPANGMGHGGSDLGQGNVSEQWPLIRYLLDRPKYMAIYKNEVKDFADNAFSTEQMDKLLDKYEKLCSPYANQKPASTNERFGPQGNGFEGIRNFVAQRQKEIAELLKQNP